MRVGELLKKLNEFCPFCWQEDFDNSGLQFGNLNAVCGKVLFAFDLTMEAVNRAVEKNCGVIITHHPFFFSDIKSIDNLSFKGKIIEKLFQTGINVISCHTNWDKHPKGISFALAEQIGLENKEILFPEGDCGFGIMGNIEETDFKTFRNKISERLEIDIKYYYGDNNIKIKKIGVLGGSGGEFIDEAKERGLDAFITGDLSYHDGQRARELDFPVIDAGHYNTEKYGMKYLIDFVEMLIPGTEVFINPITDESY